MSNIGGILSLLRQVVGADKMTEPDLWSVLTIEVEGSNDDLKGTVSDVQNVPVNTLSITIDYTEGGTDKQVVLKASASTVKMAKISVNDKDDSDARLIFSNKGNIGNPSRWGFDFKEITIDGKDYRFNLRFDP